MTDALKGIARSFSPYRRRETVIDHGRRRGMRGGAGRDARLPAEGVYGREDGHRMAVSPHQEFGRTVGVAQADQIPGDVLDLEISTVTRIRPAGLGEEPGQRGEPPIETPTAMEHDTAAQQGRVGAGRDGEEPASRGEQASAPERDLDKSPGEDAQDQARDDEDQPLTLRRAGRGSDSWRRRRAASARGRASRRSGRRRPSDARRGTGSPTGVGRGNGRS